jgi:hypothetical protein
MSGRSVVFLSQRYLYVVGVRLFDKGGLSLIMTMTRKQSDDTFCDLALEYVLRIDGEMFTTLEAYNEV